MVAQQMELDSESILSMMLSYILKSTCHHIRGMLFFKRANVCDAKNLTGFSNVKQIVVFRNFYDESQSHEARTRFTLNHCPKVSEETFYESLFSKYYNIFYRYTYCQQFRILLVWYNTYPIRCLLIEITNQITRTLITRT